MKARRYSMRKINVDIAIIGGGPAGLAAAMSAHEHGLSLIHIFKIRETLL